MSILSDIEIKELCITPKYDVEYILNHNKTFITNELRSIEEKIVQKEEEEEKKEEPMIRTTDLCSYVHNYVVKAKSNIEEEHLKQLLDKKFISNYHITEEYKLNKYLTNPMIYPFEEKLISKIGDYKIISKGLSSFGYDVTLDTQFKLFNRDIVNVVDPLNFDGSKLIETNLEVFNGINGEYIILQPKSYLLGKTVEVFNIPKDILVVCVGKSTYARSGVSINVTPIEPGFIGNIVIEIFNHLDMPVKIYLKHGVAQFLFFRGKNDCLIGYGDRQGKYQHQDTVQTPL